MKIRTSVGRRLFFIINFVFLLVVGIICLLPFINLLAISFSGKAEVIAGKVTFWPLHFQLSSYEFVLQNVGFLRSFVVSLERVALGVTVNMILTVLAAYSLSKPKEQLRAKNVYAWFFVVTILFNGGMIPTYMIVRYTGLLDSIWALILPGAVQVFNVLVVMNFFKGLPQELDEAAFIDGASHIQTLLMIILPISTPALATVGLFSLVGHWNSWFDGLLYMNKVEHYPLQSFLQTIIVKPESFFQKATYWSDDMKRFLQLIDARTMTAATLFLAALPVLLVYPFLQRYFTTGLVMGSVKG